MLILTRKPDEAIIIGDNAVKIILLSVNGNQVRLGFEGDEEISIHREEIFNRIQQEKVQHEKNN